LNKIRRQIRRLRTFRNEVLSRAGVLSVLLLVLWGFYGGATSILQAGQTSRSNLYGTVSGVSPAGENFIVEGARLELDGSASGLPSLAAYSDSKGAYKFATVTPGNYLLKVTSPGFKEATKKVTVAPDKATIQDVRLELAEVHQEIEVRESAPQVSQQSTAPPATLSAPSLKTVPTAQTKYKEALPFVPSVVRTQDEKIYIMGTEETQGLLLTNSLETVEPVTGTFDIDVPIDAIDTLEVFKAPFLTQYGGFSGGLTSINTRAPSSRWRMSMNDLNPSIRGKAGHWVGFSKAEPRLYFTGPLSKKLSFAEAFVYEMRKDSIRGLAWPHDQTKTQGFTSFTTFQYMFSPTHLTIVRVNLFPRRQQFANLNALVPQTASSDFGQRGYSISVTDSYQFASGALVASQFKLTGVTSYSHGQGSSDMLVTPNGLAGNYFNAWNRDSHQEEGLETFQFPMQEWLGKHSLMVGGDFIHRRFDGVSDSHPVLLLRTDSTLAERIDFAGAGKLASGDSQISGFVQDHWAFTDRLALDLGVRYLGESLGASTNFAPRLGFVFSPDRDGTTIFRGGIGVFDDRVPLLAGDFSNNPERMVSVFDPQGALVASPLTFANACAKRSAAGPRLLSSCSNLGSNPYNLTWRVEADRRVGSKVQVRLSFLKSRTSNVFVIDPVTPAEANPMLLLSNSGSSRYHEYEASVRYRPSEGSDLTVTYVHSRSHGDLNSVYDVFVPFEQPVIRPDRYASLPSDVPDRLTALGRFRIPYGFILVPAIDLHSGFPYSEVDVLQDYAGTPNNRRFPIYFSADWRIYRDFPLPFRIHKGHKFRFGIYSVDTTGRQNPHDVYNNVTSPMFGTFTGLGKRTNGIVIGFAE
jgi:Carboxypeptidase regulatory-like domain/TonB dependent receptor-like, beta-barrel